MRWRNVTVWRIMMTICRTENVMFFIETGRYGIDYRCFYDVGIRRNIIKCVCLERKVAHFMIESAPLLCVNPVTFRLKVAYFTVENGVVSFENVRFYCT